KKQQPRHHLRGVFQHQGSGRLDAHGALDPFGAEMQVADAVGFRKRGLVESMGGGSDRHRAIVASAVPCGLSRLMEPRRCPTRSRARKLSVKPSSAPRTNWWRHSIARRPKRVRKCWPQAVTRWMLQWRCRSPPAWPNPG